MRTGELTISEMPAGWHSARREMSGANHAHFEGCAYGLSSVFTGKSCRPSLRMRRGSRCVQHLLAEIPGRSAAVRELSS